MSYRSERSLADVLQDIVGNIQGIIRAEFQLAKTEITEETSKAANAVAVLASGAAVGLYAGGFLLLTAVRALELLVAPWLASLIVSILAAVSAYIVIRIGRKRLKRVHAPQKTIQTVKENVEWAKDQVR